MRSGCSPTLPRSCSQRDDTPVDRPTLLAFTAADALWVAGSAVVLLLFWSQFTPLARTLVIVVALAVDVFATLQYRAAGTTRARTLGVA